MRLERRDSADSDGPVLRIYYKGDEEAFEMGRFVESLFAEGICVWIGDGWVQFPLMLSDNGLAVPFPKR